LIYGNIKRSLGLPEGAQKMVAVADDHYFIVGWDTHHCG